MYTNQINPVETQALYWRLFVSLMQQIVLRGQLICPIFGSTRNHRMCQNMIPGYQRETLVWSGRSINSNTIEKQQFLTLIWYEPCRFYPVTAGFVSGYVFLSHSAEHPISPHSVKWNSERMKDAVVKGFFGFHFFFFFNQREQLFTFYRRKGMEQKPANNTTSTQRQEWPKDGIDTFTQ